MLILYKQLSFLSCVTPSVRYLCHSFVMSLRLYGLYVTLLLCHSVSTVYMSFLLCHSVSTIFMSLLFYHSASTVFMSLCQCGIYVTILLCNSVIHGPAILLLFSSVNRVFKSNLYCFTSLLRALVRRTRFKPNKGFDDVL